MFNRMLSSTEIARVAGLELSEEMVQVAGRTMGPYVDARRLELRVGTVEKLPYPDETFTKLITVNTFYFWNDPAKALRESHRVLATNGQLVLCFNSKEDLATWPGHKFGFNLYEPEQVTQMLSAASFHEIEVRPFQDPTQGRFFCILARKAK